MERKWRDVIVAYFSVLVEHFKEQQNNTTLNILQYRQFLCSDSKGNKYPS